MLSGREAWHKPGHAVDAADDWTAQSQAQSRTSRQYATSFEVARDHQTALRAVKKPAYEESGPEALKTAQAIVGTFDQQVDKATFTKLHICR